MTYEIPPNPALPDGIYVTVKQNGKAYGIRLNYDNQLTNHTEFTIVLEKAIDMLYKASIISPEATANAVDSIGE